MVFMDNAEDLKMVRKSSMKELFIDFYIAKRGVYLLRKTLGCFMCDTVFCI